MSYIPFYYMSVCIPRASHRGSSAYKAKPFGMAA